MTNNPTDPAIRRVVTGHDSNNVAQAITDGPATNAKHVQGIVSTLIWSTDDSPSDISIGLDIEDRGARQMGTAPPPLGSRFCIIDFPPNGPYLMHRTETLDYVIVISGEIDMDMDDSTVKLKAGDVMVQRGTNHAWINRSPQSARLAFVLLDATPLDIGKAVTGHSTAGHGPS